MSNEAKENIEKEQQESPEKQEETEGQKQSEAEKKDVNDSEDQTEDLQLLLEQAKEDVLRAQAEAQNVRRRSEAEVEKARKFALERFISDLLPVVDNLDRALGSIDLKDESLKAVVDGIELTRKSFLDTLEKNHVKQLNPEGEPFNADEHQAMTMVPNPDLEPNTVMEVFQKGYSLNGRLIRPAMVVVSKSQD